MKAAEANQIATEAKAHLLSEVKAYAAAMVEEIKKRVKEQANRGYFTAHFRSSPDSAVPYNVRKETLPLVFKQLNDEGYTVKFSGAEHGPPNSFEGGFTISW